MQPYGAPIAQRSQACMERLSAVPCCQAWSLWHSLGTIDSDLRLTPLPVVKCSSEVVRVVKPDVTSPLLWQCNPAVIYKTASIEFIDILPGWKSIVLLYLFIFGEHILEQALHLVRSHTHDPVQPDFDKSGFETQQRLGAIDTELLHWQSTQMMSNTQTLQWVNPLLNVHTLYNANGCKKLAFDCAHILYFMTSGFKKPVG